MSKTKTSVRIPSCSANLTVLGLLAMGAGVAIFAVPCCIFQRSGDVAVQIYLAVLFFLISH